jgi:hypothetical protein
MIKPVVHYKGTPQFYLWPYPDENGKDITVGKVPFVMDHPRLGRCYDVRTSDIVTPIDSEGRFETLYTIYEPYQNS